MMARRNYPMGKTQKRFLLLLALYHGVWTPDSPWAYAPYSWNLRMLYVFSLRGLVDVIEDGYEYRLNDKGWDTATKLKETGIF